MHLCVGPQHSPQRSDGSAVGLGGSAPALLGEDCAPHLHRSCRQSKVGLIANPDEIKSFLQRFMGIINCSGRFMTHLAVISEPLKGLLDTDIACHGRVPCGGAAVAFILTLVWGISV